MATGSIGAPLRLEALNELRPDVGLCTCELLSCLSDCLSHSPQYSVKEDKYELAISNLTDKLKEVRTLWLHHCSPSLGLGSELQLRRLHTGAPLHRSLLTRLLCYLVNPD